MQTDLCKSRKTSKDSYAQSRHFENNGVTKRKEVKPHTLYCRYYYQRPDNTDYNSSKWVYFTIRTGNEFLRLTPNCITFYTTIKVDPNYTGDGSNAVGALEGQNPFKQDISAEGLAKGLQRAAYFNPLAGGPATLIAEAEIVMDGQRVQINTGGHFSTTNTLNKLFCPRAVREEALGHDLILHNELDTKTYYDWYDLNVQGTGAGFDDLKKCTKALKFVLKNPKFEDVLMEVNGVGRNNNNPRICPLSGDLDGILFLSKPKNLSLNSNEACDHSLNQHPILPPNCELQIRLRLNDPLQFRMIDTKMDDQIFFAETGNDGTNPPANDKFGKGKWISLEINDITLNMEKVRPSKEKLQRSMAQGSITYVIDQYIFRAREIGPSATTSTSAFNVPENVKLCYVFLCRNTQLQFDAEGHRSSDMTRFSFPPSLRSIEIKRDGERIQHTNNLHISRQDAASQPDAVSLHQMYLHRKLTDESFKTFFPKLRDFQHGNISYKNVILVDLLPYETSKPCIIEINCTYSPKSPNNYYCVMFMPQSVTIHKPSRDSIWQSSATVG